MPCASVASPAFSEKKKLGIEAGSLEHFTTEVMMKLNIQEPIQLFIDDGPAGLSQVGDN